MTMTDASSPSPEDEYYRAATNAMKWSSRLSGCMLWAMLLPLGAAVILCAIGFGILIFG